MRYMAYFHCSMVSAPEIWTGSAPGIKTGTPSQCLHYLQLICCNSGESCFSCQRPETSRERPQRIIALRAYDIPATSRIPFTFWTAFADNFRKKSFPGFFSLPDQAPSRTALYHSSTLIIRILFTSHSLVHSSFFLDIIKGVERLDEVCRAWWNVRHLCLRLR